MMNKIKTRGILALLLTFCVIFSFTACGDNEPESSSTGKSSSTAAASSRNTADAESDEASDVSSETSDPYSSAAESSFAASSRGVSSVKSGGSISGSSNAASSAVSSTETEEPAQTGFAALKRGINVAGGLSGEAETPYTSWIFDGKYYNIIRSKGFDHIRLPVNFAKLCGGAPNYKINIEFFRQVDTVINLALNAELIVVLDFHGWSALNSNFTENEPKFYKLWEQVAERYQKYSSALMFEILNEPNGRGSGADTLNLARCNKIQLEAIRLIRKTNPTRIIAATVYDLNGIWNAWNMTLPEDDHNIIVSIHNYNIMSFTHQGQDWGSTNYPDKAKFTDAVKTSIRNSLETTKDYQDRSGRPVWLSEFGMYMGIADVEDVKAYAEYFCKTAEEMGMSWCWWEFNSGFGLFDPKTDDWKPGIVEFITN